MARTRLSDFRYVNITLGTWLFVSAFLWPHTAVEITNAVIVGAVIALVAALGLWVPMIRFVNTVAAAWLFISAVVLSPLAWETPINNVLVAVFVFFVSLFGIEQRMRAARGT